MSQTPLSYNPPPNSVIGTIPDQASLDSLRADLAQAGYPESALEAIHGQAGLDYIDPDGSAHGLWGRIVRGFQQFTTGVEERIGRVTKQALLDGKYIVVVHTDASEAQIQQVQQLMSANGGVEIFFFSHTVFRLLSGWEEA